MHSSHDFVQAVGNITVQSWIQAIRDKPETLIKAIKDAQSAANYMDYKSGVITKDEYDKLCGSIKEVKTAVRAAERQKL